MPRVEKCYQKINAGRGRLVLLEGLRITKNTSIRTSYTHTILAIPHPHTHSEKCVTQRRRPRVAHNTHQAVQKLRRRSTRLVAYD